jgi:phage terminase small subunit
VIRSESAPSDRAIQLADLAKRLRLTPLQTDFALALAADPKGNQTSSAVTAGASAKSAHVWACRTLRLAKVQRFLVKVGKAVQERLGGGRLRTRSLYTSKKPSWSRVG